MKMVMVLIALVTFSGCTMYAGLSTEPNTSITTENPEEQTTGLESGAYCTLDSQCQSGRCNTTGGGFCE